MTTARSLKSLTYGLPGKPPTGAADPPSALLPWWQMPFTPCIGAWRFRGAASAAAARVDQTGNGHALAGTPAGTTWNATQGFVTTPGVLGFFDANSDIYLPTYITAVWYGIPEFGTLTTTRMHMWSSYTGTWSGLVMHAYNVSGLYAGFNNLQSQATYSGGAAGHSCFIYSKSNQPLQRLFVDGVLHSSVSLVGTPANRYPRLYLGIQCWAVALYNGAFVDQEVALMTYNCSQL